MSKRLETGKNNGPFTKLEPSAKELREVSEDTERANREMRAAERADQDGAPLPDVPPDLYHRVSEVLAIEDDSQREEKRKALAAQLSYTLSHLSARIRDWKAGKNTEYLNAEVEDIESYVAHIRTERDRLENGYLPMEQEDSLAHWFSSRPSEIEDDREYTYDEAASLLRIKTQTVRRYVSKRVIPARNVRGRGYITGRSIRTYRDGLGDNWRIVGPEVSFSPQVSHEQATDVSEDLLTIEVPDSGKLKKIVELFEDLEDWQGMSLQFARAGTSTVQAFVDQNFHVSGQEPRRTTRMLWEGELRTLGWLMYCLADKKHVVIPGIRKDCTGLPGWIAERFDTSELGSVKVDSIRSEITGVRRQYLFFIASSADIDGDGVEPLKEWQKRILWDLDISTD